MQLKTILNRVQKFKSFVYKSVRWVGNEAAPELEVEVAERANGKPVCSGCGHHRPGYDRLAKRRFEFVPLWGIKVFLVYAPRRVECPSCGIRQACLRPRDRFWGLGCPKIYHEAEDTLAYFPSGARHAGKTVRPRGYWGLPASASLSMAGSV